MGLSSLNAATKKVLVIVVIVIAVVAVGWYTYHRYRVEQAMKYPKFYSGNGRLEATEVYVSAKNGGRIEQIFVKEGDLVRKGDKLVQMQTDTLEAELKSVKAEIVMAEATIKQKEIALTNANREYLRLKGLLEKNATSEQKYDNAETAYLSAKANLEYAQGQLKKQQAEKERVEADIKDALLVAKYDGRIQDLLAHEGEVRRNAGRT